MGLLDVLWENKIIRWAMVIGGILLILSLILWVLLILLGIVVLVAG